MGQLFYPARCVYHLIIRASSKGLYKKKTAPCSIENHIISMTVVFFLVKFQLEMYGYGILGLILIIRNQGGQ